MQSRKIERRLGAAARRTGSKRRLKRPATTRGATASPVIAKRELGASAGSGEVPILVSADARHNLIAIAAYLRAERRGFQGGSPEQDWLEAEAEVDRALAGDPDLATPQG